jgi:hypothetical protein
VKPSKKPISAAAAGSAWAPGVKAKEALIKACSAAIIGEKPGLEGDTRRARTLRRGLAGKAQRFLLCGAFGAFLFGARSRSAARIIRAGTARHAARREQIEQDIIAPLIHGPIRGRQAKRIPGIQIRAAIHRITRRRQITACDGVKQGGCW